MTTEQVNKAEEFIIFCESEFFTGTHSVSFITKDLQTRKASDRYSTLGSNSRQTNLLSAKKQVYFETFNNVYNGINLYLNMLQKSYPNHALISRCERCKEQIEKLRNIVQDF